MATFKNIRIKMKGGKSRMQRVKVLASGKYKFVKNLTKRGPKTPTRRTRRKTNPGRKRGVRRMGRRKRRRGGKSIQRTAFKFIRIGALVGGGLMEGLQYGPTQDKVIATLLSYAGIHYGQRKFDGALLARTWTPYLMASIATYGIPKLTSIIRKM